MVHLSLSLEQYQVSKDIWNPPLYTSGTMTTSYDDTLHTGPKKWEKIYIFDAQYNGFSTLLGGKNNGFSLFSAWKWQVFHFLAP